MRIYNILGQIVVTLFEGNAVAGIIHQVTFDASGLPTGVYISQLNVDGKQLTRKMVLMK